MQRTFALYQAGVEQEQLSQLHQLLAEHQAQDNPNLPEDLVGLPK